MTPDTADDTPSWWKGGRTTARHAERLPKNRDRMLGIAILRQLGQIARSVAYLELTFDGGRATGTGFLIAPDLLLTNHHNVFHEEYGPVRAITADFDREEGFTVTPLVIKGVVPPIAVSAEGDWAVIRLERAVTDREPIALGTKWEIGIDDQIFIVQHPLGGFKKYAQDALSLQYLDADVIQYLADTQKGSSGSPVFNSRLHCIALHHAEAEIEEGAGAETKTVYRNEGIRIERVMEGLRGANIPFDDSPEAFITKVKKQLAQPAGAPDFAEQRALEMAYLRRVQAVASPLPIDLIDPRAAESNRRQTMDLLPVYVALNTETLIPVKEGESDRGKRRASQDLGMPERETRPLSVLEATTRERKMVLLGDPGSGKSTFLNYLALCLAGARLEQAGEASNLAGDRWLEQLQPVWVHGALLPLHVTLRRFARSAACDGTESGLWRHICETLAEHGMSDFAPVLRRRLLEGGILVLFDGLDEVSNPDQRKIVRDAVDDFATAHDNPTNRFLVTCRIYAYQDPCCQLGRFVDHRLAALEPEQSRGFIESWYREVARRGWKDEREAAEMTDSLQKAIRRPDLAALARNPLQLTMMASLHYSWGRLPDDRVALYKEMVALLLVRWQESRLGESSGVLRSLSYGELESALEEVAFVAHLAQGSGEGTADISEATLLSVLQRYLGGKWDKAKELAEYIQQRAALLPERVTGVYTFPHRSYQEYLAASHLAVQSDFPDQAATLARNNYAQWREVVLWAVAVMAHPPKKMPHFAVDVAAALCPDELPAVPISDADWRMATLSGEALAEIGLSYFESHPRHGFVLARTRQWLTGLMEQGGLAPLERARAGQTLARLGDPREGVGVKDGLPNILWSDPIPAGTFPMGNSKENDPEAYDDEEPRHDEVIEAPYRISVYPITNTQYDAFVRDGGYRNPDYWQEAAAEGFWNEDRVRRRYYKRDEGGNLETVEEWADAPAYFSSPFDLPNHPVVGINWFEAVAFCLWLSEKGGHKVELPTEAQWERAARSTDGRKYPWNSEITPDHANYGMNVGTTTAVGIFPLGAAECGALDMSGNVWEWCRTKWRENYNTGPDDSLSGQAARVLRGGAFGYLPRYVRCAFRFGNDPDGRLDCGFRVVASP